MKTIFLILFFAILFFGCKPRTSNRMDELTKGLGDNKTSGNAWTNEDKEKFMEDCVRKPGEEKGGTKELCSCLLIQSEKYFSSFESYDKMKEDNPEWQRNGENFNKAVETCRSELTENNDNTSQGDKKEVDIWGDTKDDIGSDKKEVIIKNDKVDNQIKYEKKNTDIVKPQSRDIPISEKNDNANQVQGWSAADKKRFMNLYPSNSRQLRLCWLETAQAYYDSYDAYSKSGSKSTDYYRALLECRSKYSK